MSRIIIYPYSMEATQSDRRIQDEIEERLPNIDCIRVYPDRAYRPRAGDLIVGWGSGNWPNWRGLAVDQHWLNNPAAVSRCVNKIESFRLFKEAGVSIPPVTTTRRTAADWAKEGWKVLARGLTEARDGEGAIVLASEEEVLASSAPLFTLLIPKQAEYRVHVFGDRVLGVQKRVRRDDAEITNRDIRTSGNGWGLTRDWNVEVPEAVLEHAGKAVKALGLDFGAVDIAVSRIGGPFVFEVNSAPEVLGDGVDRYAEAIIACLD